MVKIAITNTVTKENVKEGGESVSLCVTSQTLARFDEIGGLN